MARTKYPSVLFLFYVLWAMALLVAMTAPENKYGWMIEVGRSVSQSNLPEDPDANTEQSFLPASDNIRADELYAIQVDFRE